MKIIDKKLDLITSIWNDFILESRFCQSRINFTREVRSNYYGDIMNYFSDTFWLVKFNDKENSLQEEIFEITSILQIIYVHQDLVEELLYIFKFDKDKMLSECSIRKFNRDIRNELVGHPIRRDKSNQNQLVSSVLYNPNPSEGKLEYIVYESSNDFKGKVKSYSKKEIISNHKTYLNKYFDIILDKLFKILQEYLLEHKNLLGVFNRKVEFPILIKYLEDKFEYFFGTSQLSKANELLKVYEMKNIHKRYSYTLEKFKIQLEIMIIERILFIQEILNVEIDLILNSRKKELQNFEEQIISTFRLTSNNYRYMLSKLVEKKLVFNIESFKGEFKEEDEIIKELEFMEKNINDDVKYISSWNLLSKLISEKLIARQ